MGSRFPERRNLKYRVWIAEEHPCVLNGRWTMVRICPYDRRHETGAYEPYFQRRIIWRHVCWGRIDPAHVNETVAHGADDVGETVPLCRGAHRMLDQVLGPAEFAQVTGLDLSNLAAGFALKYAEQGGRVLLGG